MLTAGVALAALAALGAAEAFVGRGMRFPT
jgi:hypothetical protein